MKTKDLEILQEELENEVKKAMQLLQGSKEEKSKEALKILRKAKKIYKESISLSDKRFQELFSHSPVPIAIYEAVDNGEDFVFVEFNPAAEKAEKVKKKDLIGKRVTEVFPGVEEFGLLDVFKEVWKTGRKKHHPLKVYKDKRIVGYRENDVFKLPSGKIVAIYRDLTKEKLTEEKLKESEKRYRTLFDFGIDAIFIHPYKKEGFGKFIDVNKIACERLGYSREELLQMTPADISAEPDAEVHGSKVMREKLKKSGYRIFSATHITKDGVTIPVEIVSSIMNLDGEKVIVSVARDISERKKAEDEINKRLNELQRFNKAMIGREMKMIELKREINELRTQLGFPKKYNVK